MKVLKSLTDKQLKRTKWLFLLGLSSAFFGYITSEFAVQAEENIDGYSGPFFYEGTQYDKY